MNPTLYVRTLTGFREATPEEIANASEICGRPNKYERELTAVVDELQNSPPWKNINIGLLGAAEATRILANNFVDTVENGNR